MTRSKTRSGSAYFVKEVEDLSTCDCGCQSGLQMSHQTLKGSPYWPLMRQKWANGPKSVSIFAIQRKKDLDSSEAFQRSKAREFSEANWYSRRRRETRTAISLKYKVRWVVRGFEQQYGKDYDSNVRPGRV